jgi:N-acyl-D-aspartate/D-glutamate deacylase
MSPRWRTYVDLMEDAIAEGLPIRGQILPRPAGAMFGLDLTFHPFVLNPSYKEIANLPLAEKVAAMRDPERRARIIAEAPSGTNPFIAWVVTQTHLLFPLGSPPNYAPDINDNLRARAERAGIDPKELIYDELLRDDGHAILYFPMGTTGDGRFDGTTDMFDRPGIVVALGDGGAHYGSVCDAAYTTFVLTQYVRGSTSTRYRMPIEKAVRMLTSDPAAAVGLDDRGLLAPGYKADLNVIDLDRLCLHTPAVQRDLPANGKRLMQRADGYDATIVAGTITYRDGIATGALPGRLIRGQQQRPAA